MTLNVRVEGAFEVIRVWLNETLHVQFDRRRFLGLQSWRTHDSKYCIEINFTKGLPMRIEYTSREKWEQVLSGLAGVMTYG